MQTFPSILIKVFSFAIALVVMTGCSPPKNATGCAEGGNGVFSSEDVRCYLDSLTDDPAQRINDQTLILFAEPEAISDWAGAAILFHEPSESILVLDPSGIPLPQSSYFTHQAGLAELAEIVTDPKEMAGIRQKLSNIWGALEPGDLEIRLGVAWQNGSSTIFIVAVAGLAPEDGRFYCPVQTWMIGDMQEEIVTECVESAAGTPVNRVFFEEKTIEEARSIPVTVALDGVLSNEVYVRNGDYSVEYRVYAAALEHLARRPLIVRGETVPGFDAELDLNESALSADLVQNYQAANNFTFSLRYVFPIPSGYIIQPKEVVFRDYLQGDPGHPDQVCSIFRNEYPGLNGVATLSRIGFNSAGTRALVHITIDCGSVDRAAEYLLLNLGNDGDWGVVETFPATPGFPRLVPQMDYQSKAGGCSDIFVYASNKDGTEFLWVAIDARGAGLSSQDTLTLNWADHPDLLGSQVYVYPETPELNPFCNDVSPSSHPQSVWQAVSGTVTVIASATPVDEPCTGEPYDTTITLENVIFQLGSQTVELAKWTFENVTVGWCAG